MKPTDFNVEDHGSLILVHLNTKRARSWIKKHVLTESWQWLGNAIAVEPRYTEELIFGMKRAGLAG